MGNKSFRFDPVTRDLVRNGSGWFEMTSNASTTVLHQLLVHADESWHDEELGSLLHNLRALQRDPLVAVPEEARRALGILVSRGRISNLEVAAEIPTAGRVNVATKFRDTSTGQLVATKIPAGR